MSEKIIVSIVMATFNEPPIIIRKSIESILNQSFKEFELIIVDDSTNFGTKSEIDSFYLKDNRIKLFRTEARLGFVNSLNLGLKNSRGEFIARMDGDDISVLNRLKKQVDFFNEHPEIDVLGGSMFIIDESDTVTSERIYPESFNRIKLLALFRSPVAHPTVMFRQKLVNEGYYYNNCLKRSEDIDLWLRMINNGVKFANINDKLLYYRVVGDLAEKRNREHFKFNFRVRVGNFNCKKPLFSVISILISFIYLLTPQSLISQMYKKENRNNIC